MTLVTEDGTGLSTSESYISVSDAETRLASFGDTTFSALTTAEKEQALRKATQYIEQRFRSRWRGTRLLAAQALSWPRYGAIVDGFNVSSTIVPTDVANAAADLALISLSETLNPNLDRAIIREKTGPIETEYAPGSAEAKRWVGVSQSLAPYWKYGAMNVALVTR